MVVDFCVHFKMMILDENVLILLFGFDYLGEFAVHRDLTHHCSPKDNGFLGLSTSKKLCLYA